MRGSHHALKAAYIPNALTTDNAQTPVTPTLKERQQPPAEREEDGDDHRRYVPKGPRH